MATVRLAHPLTPAAAARLGLEEKDHFVNTEIEVSDDVARSIINAGYAQVDPEDAKQVEAALTDGPQAVADLVEQQAQAGSYDPGAYSVDEVNAYLATADDTERERVLAAERAGQKRKGIVGG